MNGNEFQQGNLCQKSSMLLIRAHMVNSSLFQVWRVIPTNVYGGKWLHLLKNFPVKTNSIMLLISVLSTIVNPFSIVNVKTKKQKKMKILSSFKEALYELKATPRQPSQTILLKERPCIFPRSGTGSTAASASRRRRSAVKWT